MFGVVEHSNIRMNATSVAMNALMFPGMFIVIKRNEARAARSTTPRLE